VTHHAADVDTVGGGNETVPLIQGLEDHFVSEFLVEVRRGGEEPRDVDPGLRSRWSRRGRPLFSGGPGPVACTPARDPIDDIPGVVLVDAVSNVQKGPLCTILT
jgi:hypothetical protein